MNIKKWLQVPMGVLQLATHAKSFKDNPVLGSRRLNELGLYVARRRLAVRMAAYRRAALARRLTPEERRAFEADGFFVRHPALPQAQFAALREEVRTLRAQGWEMRQGRAVTRRVSLDRPVLQQHVQCRAWVGNRLARDLIAYAAAHDGAITYQIQSVVVDAARAEVDPQTLLHSDTFHATAKSWLFLHDVGADDGPFMYVPGSHRLTPARLAWEQRQSVLASRSADSMHAEGSFRIEAPALPELGLPAPMRMEVSANTLVVADTSGFHARAASRRSTHRVEIYGSLRRNPFLPWCAGHALALPLIAGNQMALDVRLKRLMGLERGGHWRAFDQLGAYDRPSV